MKRFAIIGAAGYIAPRHLNAIKATGNEVVAAMDVNDSVGILDSYFPKADFFTEFEQFEAFVEDEKLEGRKLDFISICSPNYLHTAHMKFALRNGVDVICEKPLVLNTEDLEVLAKYENEYGAKVNSILQLRIHEEILKLKEKVRNSPNEKVFDVTLTYLTSRGRWYLKSWKGLNEKSGGISTNIGVHFYDMLQYVFGDFQRNEVHHRDNTTSSGYLEFKRARVRWFLSVDAKFLPKDAVKGEKLTYRSIDIDGEAFEFSNGFTDLHTESYRRILAGRGFGTDENRAAIEMVSSMREMPILNAPEFPHPLFLGLTP